MFIQTQETPNPNCLKFLPGKVINKGSAIEYKSLEEADKSSFLAAQLLKIEGVISLFIDTDYITISKAASYNWDQLKPDIIDIMLSYFLENDEACISPHQLPKKHDHDRDKDPKAYDAEQEYYDPCDEQIVKAIKELLESHIQPAVARDGGSIKFCAYKNGIVYLSMHGACSGCPSAAATLKQGVENLLKHYIPQIAHVEAVEE